MSNIKVLSKLHQQSLLWKFSWIILPNFPPALLISLTDIATNSRSLLKQIRGFRVWCWLWFWRYETYKEWQVQWSSFQKIRRLRARRRLLKYLPVLWLPWYVHHVCSLQFASGRQEHLNWTLVYYSQNRSRMFSCTLFQFLKILSDRRIASKLQQQHLLINVVNVVLYFVNNYYIYPSYR